MKFSLFGMLINIGLVIILIKGWPLIFDKPAGFVVAIIGGFIIGWITTHFGYGWFISK